jgi:predicted DNA-binding transcriptional regulator AlpA
MTAPRDRSNAADVTVEHLRTRIKELESRLQAERLRDPCRVYRARELGDLLDIHPMTVWRWARRRNLPKPIKIGPATTVWRASEIVAWLANKSVSE